MAFLSSLFSNTCIQKIDEYDVARLPINLKESSFCAHSMSLSEGELQCEAHLRPETLMTYENSNLFPKSLEKDLSRSRDLSRFLLFYPPLKLPLVIRHILTAVQDNPPQIGGYELFLVIHKVDTGQL